MDAGKLEPGADLAALYGPRYFATYTHSPGGYWSTALQENRRQLAASVVRDLAPESVLDAGCAMGGLVEEFRLLGVAAFGVDVSEHAIAEVPETVREFCRVASLAERQTRRYDLVICTEVIEHISSADTDRVFDALCSATDRVLFSSAPDDYADATHVNVRPTEAWAAAFARRGFFRQMDYDASYVAPWAALFVRSDLADEQIVRRYETELDRSRRETLAVRQVVLEQQQLLESGFSEVEAGLRAETARLTAALYEAETSAQAAEIRAVAAQKLAAAAEAELAEVPEVTKMLRSRSGSMFRSYHRLRGRMRKD